MKIAVFQFSLFGINTYVVYDPASKECLIVDPGMSTPEEEKAITEFISRNDFTLIGVVNTHLHIDHAVGNETVVKLFNVPVKANSLDLPLGERIQQQAMMFGMRGNFNDVSITEDLKEGDIIRVGDGELKVLWVPGHSPGSIALYDAKDGFVITGDALFQGSVGRSDLPGGDHETLINSIKTKLLPLPDSTIVYPGHGNPTTIGDEKRFNPFLR